jgi:hypothetical protein
MASWYTPVVYPAVRKSRLGSAPTEPRTLNEFTMNPQKKFHLLFSVIMAAMMVFLVTFVVTLANLGWAEHFVAAWAKSFMIAYGVTVPVIFFVAPVARRITGQMLGVQPA